MKLHKVMVWHKRRFYYIVSSNFRLYMTKFGDGLAKTRLDATMLQERLTECSLVQKQ